MNEYNEAIKKAQAKYDEAVNTAYDIRDDIANLRSNDWDQIGHESESTKTMREIGEQEIAKRDAEAKVIISIFGAAISQDARHTRENVKPAFTK